MKNILLIFVVLVIATSVLAQGRPAKEICLELTNTCAQIDSLETVELKILFNSLVDELQSQLKLQREFNNAGEVIKRLQDFNNRLTTLRAAKDAVTDEVVKNLIQVKIDKLVKVRDKAHSTKNGSRRYLASKAEAVISKLNRQLNNVESAL